MNNYEKIFKIEKTAKASTNLLIGWLARWNGKDFKRAETDPKKFIKNLLEIGGWGIEAYEELLNGIEDSKVEPWVSFRKRYSIEKIKNLYKLYKENPEEAIKERKRLKRELKTLF